MTEFVWVNVWNSVPFGKFICLLYTSELQQYLDTYESTHDYDEYHFDLADIEHDPYVLISAITALKGKEWTISEVGGILEMLFEKQYILTETVTKMCIRDRNKTEREEQ